VALVSAAASLRYKGPEDGMLIRQTAMAEEETSSVDSALAAFMRLTPDQRAAAQNALPKDRQYVVRRIERARERAINDFHTQCRRALARDGVGEEETRTIMLTAYGVAICSMRQNIARLLDGYTLPLSMYGPLADACMVVTLSAPPPPKKEAYPMLLAPKAAQSPGASAGSLRPDLLKHLHDFASMAVPTYVAGRFDEALVVRNNTNRAALLESFDEQRKHFSDKYDAFDDEPAELDEGGNNN
jgi:hypothetical protein